MALNQHKTDINLISSIDALTEILSESRIAAEPAFRDRPMSTNDPVPDNPYWTPKNCYLHALNRFHKRWPNAEGIICSDTKAAVDYAVNVLDDVWPDDENGRQAEKMISRDPSRALWYAKMVKGRWEEIEPAMASKANWAYEYAKSVLEHRWDGPHAKDAEVSITSDPYIATLYCVDLKYSKRYDNPRIERMILDSIYGALYAHTVAPKLTIQEINQEVDSRLEALNVGQNIDLSEVFEESWESWTDAASLKPDPKTSRPIVLVYYAQEKLKHRWPEAEPYILEKCRRNDSIDEIHHLFAYAINVIKPYDKKNPDYDRGRWLEAEPIIKTDSHVAYNYALAILKERWQDPEVELLILNSDSAKYYAEYVAKTSEDELREDVENKIKDMHRHDDIDLSDTTEEAIERLLPLIVEAVVERDYSAMTPTTVYTYAITDFKTKQLHGEDYEPDPKAEAVIMKDPGAACYYARDVINDGKCQGIRWKEAEPIIMSEPYWAYAYAKDVLGERWKEAEKVIKRNTYIAYLYARYIVKPSDPSDYDYDKGRWDLQTESRILEDHDPVIPENDSEKESEICELYANNVAEMSIEELRIDIDRKIGGMRASDEIDLSGTTEEGFKNTTPIIVESREDEKRAMALFHIALDKKNAKEEGLTLRQKNQILKSPEYAYKYAKYVLDGEWVEAEPIILTDLYWAFNYAKSVIGGRWKAAEPLILGGKDFQLALSYATDVSKIRLDPMVELKIIEHFEDDEVDDDGYYLDDYCTRVAKMSVEDLKADAEMKISDLTNGDDIDLSGTTEEAIDRLLPPINESKKEPDPSIMTLQEIYEYLTKRKNRGKRWPEAEPYIMKDPRYAFFYTLDVINKEKDLGKRWPKAEPYIMKDPKYAYAYTHYVINKRKTLGKRWPEAEPYIKTSPGYAFDYAYYVINKEKDLGIRWPEAEPFIKTSPEFAYKYADYVINKGKNLGIRWPEAESYIIKDGRWSHQYTLNVALMPHEQFLAEVKAVQRDLHPQEDKDFTDIDESIDRLMPLITESKKEPDPSKMTQYEIYRYVNKGKNRGKRWPEAEPYIMKDPRYAFFYTLDVINKGKNLGKRWRKAEPYIKTSPGYACKYAIFVINKEKGLGIRWPEAEPSIKTSPEYACRYADYVINKRKNLGKRWPEAEPYIITSPEYVYEYVDYVINRRKNLGIRWPEAEPYILRDKRWAERYARNIAKMPYEQFLAEVEAIRRDLHPNDQKDLTGIDESIDRLVPLIIEGLLPDPKKLTPQECYNYAYNFILKMDQDGKCEQWLRDAEEIIKHDPEYASAYAKNVLNHEPIRKADRKKRFINAEEYIMKSPKWAYIYARDIYSKSGQRDKLRWEDAEPFILQDPKYAYFYAQYVAHMPLEEIQAEVDIKMGQMFPDENKDLSDTTEESIDRLMLLITENEWDVPDFNKISPINAFNYVYFRSLNMDSRSKMRYPEAERTILKDPHVASLYAQFVMGERWYIAEPSIIKDLGRAKVYADKLVKIPFKDFLYEVRSTSKFLNNNDDVDLSGTTDEAIDRLMPLISENELDPANQDVMRRTAVECYIHANYVIQKPWPKAEPKILTHPYASFLYAKEVIEGPWPKAEEIISTHAKSARLYAQYVLKRRFIEGEDAIKKDPEEAYYYAENVLKPFDSIEKNPSYNNGRWDDPKTELLILNAPWELPYAERIAGMTRKDLMAELKHKMKDISPNDDIDLTDTTEESIERLLPLITEENEALPDFTKMSPVEAFEYVWGVINQDKYLGISCPEAEPIISKDPELAYYYAVSIINKDKNLGIPWPEAERVNGGLRDSPKWAFFYVRDVLNQGIDKRHIENGIRWLDCEKAIITDKTATAMYAKDIAKMPVDEFINEVKNRDAGITHRDDEDLTDTFEESIDRLMPLINEANRKDYWGRRKEFKEFYPISNWLDKAINKIRARFLGSYTPQFQQSIIALKAKADEYREKGAKNFEIGSDMFSSKEPYPPKDVLDDSSIPSSIKSLLVGAFHDEESKLNKEYEKSLADKWEHDWPAPIHKKQNSIQYDLRRRLQDERIKNRKELAKYKDTTAQDDADLSEIDEE